MMIPLRSGTVIGGDYVVEHLLSSGGMGSVYVARQRSTDRLRALKVMPGEIVSDPKSHQGFLREAKIGSRIESDHVVEVVAAGIDGPTGLPWIVMELLEGDDLADWVRQHGLMPPDQAQRVLEELFHAMRAAHSAGIVHRDLKPENLFLRHTRQVGAPFMLKVLDFGIAKIVSSSTSANLTRSIGTPGWMSPEQCSQGTCSPASDVWALGLLAFYVLAGKPFWMRLQETAPSLNAILYEICLAPIPTAFERARELGVAQRLPPAFDAWFARCLEREAVRRFADASEAWNALQPVLHGVAPAAEIDHRLSAPAEQDTQIAPGRSPSLPETEPMEAHGRVEPTAPMVTAPLSRPSPGGQEEGPPRLSTTGGAVTGAASRPDSRRRVTRAVASCVVAAFAGLAAVAGWMALGEQADVGRSGVTQSNSHAPVSSRALSPSYASENPPAVLSPEDMVAFSGGSVAFDGTDHRISAFRIDRREVTVDQWNACVTAGACDRNVDDVSWSEVAPDRVTYFSAFCNRRDSAKRGKHPINCVSQPQALAYCAWAGQKRLPTLAEWMYSAFGGNRPRTFPWGEQRPTRLRLNVCGVECAKSVKPISGDERLRPFMGDWTLDDGWRETAPVGSYSRGATPEGLLDMAGNVWEWMSTAPEKEPRNRHVAGGGWYETDASMIERGLVVSLHADVRFPTLGFRCAR